MTAEQTLSAMILANMEKGMEIDQAFDAVMGEGAYRKMAGEVYRQLRGEA